MNNKKNKVIYYITDLVAMFVVFFLICSIFSSLGLGLIISVIIYHFVTKPLVKMAFKI